MTPRSEALTATLFKTAAKTFEDCIDSERLGELRRVGLPRRVGAEGALYLPGSSTGKPSWVAFIEKGFGEEFNLHSASASAVLLIRRPDGILAFTWGPAGRYLINRDVIVEDFGLKIALNSVDPERIRSTDSRTIDEASMYQRSQSSKQLPFNEFGFDASRAILQAVTGSPKDQAFAKRVTGADSVRINTKIDFEDLPTKCDELMRYYKSKEYKKAFPWLDSLRTVGDPQKIDLLDALLVKNLNAGNIDNFHMAPPEVIDWESVEGFVYPGRRESSGLEADLSLTNCLYGMTSRGTLPLDLDDLRRGSVRVRWDHSEKAQPEWTVYKTLVAQLEMDGKSYVLSSGKWFEVEQNYVKRVENELKDIPASTLKFPESRLTWTETEYNRQAAQAMDGWILTDREILRPTAAVSGIEVCDLLTKKGHFIHVKKRRSSATLSHLFAQGTVSAQTILGDEDFLPQVRKLAERVNPIAAAQVPWDSIGEGKIKVVYGIISEKQKSTPAGLPFFAKVNLLHAIRILRTLRCEVEMGNILEQAPSG